MADTSPLLALARRDPAAARMRILAALAEVNGNRTHAAERLGVRLTTLRRAIDVCSAGPEIAARWPGSERGGGVQGEAHRAKTRANLAAARETYRKSLVSPRI